MARIKCRDKKPHNVSEYLDRAFGLTINSFTVGKEGYILSWQLAVASGIYAEGNDQMSLLDALVELDTDYNLGHNKNKDGEVLKNSKRMIIIYTDNIELLAGFTQGIITSKFGNKSLEIINTLDVRSIKTWCKKVDDIYDKINNHDVCLAQAMAILMQRYFDDTFIKSKKFFMTPVQVVKTKITDMTRGWKKINNPKHEWEIEVYEKYELHEQIRKLWPTDLYMYKIHRKAIFGGILFDAYPEAPSSVYEYNIIEVDATSAYIYQMVTKKFPMRKINLEYIGYDTYLQYLNNEDYSFIGEFIVEFPKKIPQYLNYIRDIEGAEIRHSIQHRYVLTSTDVSIIKKYCKDAKVVQFGFLEVYENDYLPQEFILIVLKEFILKNKLKLEHAPQYEYDFQKEIVNACYGLAIKDFLKYITGTTEELKTLYKREKYNAILAPIWGIFTLAYARENLLNLALKLNKWIKSDTDSIFCIDTPENRAIINAYNEEIRNTLEDIKTKYNIEDDLGMLGQFKYEAFINGYIAWGNKQYAYYDYVEKKYIAKISGLQTSDLDLGEKWLQLDKKDLKDLYKPVDVWMKNENTTTWTSPCGKTFQSSGSSYNRKLSYEEYQTYCIING